MRKLRIFPNLVHKIVTDCSCALSLYIVNGHCKGKPHRKRLKPKDRFVGFIEILGNNTSSSPLKFPFKIVASTILLFIIFFTVSLVPMQSRDGLMFRRRMIDTPMSSVTNVRWHSCGKSNEFKNSVESLNTSS